jgi:hypothetical protein
MALRTATTVTTEATEVDAVAVAVSDTVDQSDIGSRGCLLQVINGSGGSINVTLADPGSTPVGNAGTAVAQAVPAGEDRWFKLTQHHVDPATGVATITYSSATSVTCKLIKA